MTGYEKIISEMPYNVCGDYIVNIRYKYSFQDTYERSNEFVTITPEGATWDMDWWEGQDDVDLMGFIALEDVYVPYTKEWQDHFLQLMLKEEDEE